MKIAILADGITTTVIDDAMNRAPVSVFKNALLARNFWDGRKLILPK